ncbi:MAG: hypothetical protein ACR2LL_04095 [Nitrosopumilus sp.]
MKQARNDAPSVPINENLTVSTAHVAVLRLEQDQREQTQETD